MEEILASIRRIIADDQSMPGHVETAPRREAPRQLPMASEAGHAEPPAPHSDTISEPPVDEIIEPSDFSPDLPPEHGVVAAPQFVSPEGPASVMGTPHPLAPAPELADTSSSDVLPPLDEPDVHESALREMHEEPDLLLHEYEPSPQEPPMRDMPGARSPGLFSAETSQSLAAAFNTLAISRLAADSHELRGLAQDMLRPLLKDWLDENLPSMVEAIIRDEIDRMSRRPG